MLTYTPAEQRPLPQPTEKPWILLLLCFAWLIPGMVGHDPWKPEETITADIVLNFLQSKNWLFPVAAGQPVLDHPPLFYWVATAFSWVLSPWLLSVHDAARVASVACMGFALWGIGLAGRELIGRRYGRNAVMILMSCLGLFLWGHHLSGSLMVLAAYAIACWGLGIGGRNPVLTGGLFGGALLVAFMAGSLNEPILLSLTALLLLITPTYRTYRYAIALLAAYSLAIPLGLFWVINLKHQAPELFNLWFQQQSLGPFGGFATLSTGHEFGYYFRLLPWFTLPAWPLALWTLWKMRQDWNNPRIALPVILSLVQLSALVMSGELHESDILPILIPLSLLAASGLDRLKQGPAALLNWFGTMTFGLTAAIVWFGWAALYLQWPAALARQAHAMVPSFAAPISWGAVLAAALMLAIWVWTISRKHPLGRQAITNWAAGVTLVWGSMMALWLPAIDTSRSYRGMIEELGQHLPANGACIEAKGISPDPLAMLHYFKSVTVTPSESNEPRCHWLLTQNTEPAPSGFSLIWQGSRPGEQREILALYQRKAATKP